MASWVVLNGAPKCGSTWLVQLFRASHAGIRVPEEVQNKGWGNSSVSGSGIARMMELLSAGGSDATFYSKQHWPDPEDSVIRQALQSGKIVVCNIYRDARDMLVSRYYHNRRLGKTRLDLEAFLKHEMRQFLSDNLEYHDKWLSWAANGSDRGRYVLSSYEALCHDLPKHGARFLELVLGRIGRPVNQDLLVKWANETHFSNYGNTGEGKFLRKGTAFGWKDDLTDRQSAEILQACRELGYRELKDRMISFAPDLSAYFEMTDIGVSKSLA